MSTKKDSSEIYLDNNATTPVAVEVREAMLPFLEDSYGNPSSIHSAGKAAKDAVDNARRQMASLMKTKPRRIVFTGGGSEADNLSFALPPELLGRSTIVKKAQRLDGLYQK